jgi:hypothetical protein
MQRRLLLLALVICLFCLNIVGSVIASEQRLDKNNGFIPAKPFAGVLVEYNRNNLEAKRETHLLLSEHGIRSEMQSTRFGNEKIVFIQNHQTGQEWLADPGRRAYSELPRGGQVKSYKDTDDEQQYLIGILANRPCAGVNGDKQSTRVVGDSELSVWRCSDEHGRTYLQHFSTLLGMVVRQETHDGWVSELRDITFVKNSLDYFKPSKDYREISLSELIMGKLELPDYVE